MLELEDAQQKILSLVQPLRAEPVPLLQADGRILAEPLLVPHDLPAFDNSAMDGYAVRADDLKPAAPEAPVRLRLRGRTAAGETPAFAVGQGECVRIFTGSPLPPGADSVLMQEDTQSDPANPESVLALAPTKPWENVRFRGEDLRAGALAIEAGRRLGPATLSLAAAFGRCDVLVAARPVVGLLATGSELLEPGEPLRAGCLYESNRTALAHLARRAGARTLIYPLVPDELESTRGALAKAFAECDVVVTTGGVSVGELDFVKAAFAALGGELALWRVAIKPGKPFALGRLNSKLLFALPGNPVSAFVTFLLLAWPALKRFQGALELLPPSRTALLAEPLENPGERRHFMRVSVDRAGQIRLAGAQSSHILHSLARGNGLVDVAPRQALSAGSPATVMLWDES